MTKRVKIVENIPNRDALEAIIADYKADGATVGWSQQPDGKFRMEAVFNEDARAQGSKTIRSRVSGVDLHIA
jgi:hypothetical protein